MPHFEIQTMPTTAATTNHHLHRQNSTRRTSSCGSPRLVAFATIATMVYLAFLLGQQFGPGKDCRRAPVPPKIVRTSKIAIVTLNTGLTAEKYDVSMANHRAYSKCHGYDHFNAVDVLDEETLNVHPYMQKAYALRAMMRQFHQSKYEYIVWMDQSFLLNVLRHSS